MSDLPPKKLRWYYLNNYISQKVSVKIVFRPKCVWKKSVSQKLSVEIPQLFSNQNVSDFCLNCLISTSTPLPFIMTEFFLLLYCGFFRCALQALSKIIRIIVLLLNLSTWTWLYNKTITRIQQLIICIHFATKSAVSSLLKCVWIL